MIWWEKSSRHQANALSLLRGFLALALPTCILRNSLAAHWLGFIIFATGAITDYWDGWLARRYKIVSNFGKIIDPITDKILILISLACFAIKGLFSVWWIAPIFVREILVTFCRIGWLIEGNAIAAERLGKWKFGLQVAAICAAFILLLTLDYHIQGIWLLFCEVLLAILLTIALVLTVISGLSFVKSNRVLFDSISFAKFVSACGVGLIAYAPGTWGSLLGLLLVFLVHWNFWLFWAAFFFCLSIGYRAVSKLDLSETKDPQFVVIDEVLGIFITLMFIPFSWPVYVIGFLLFRIFDILKPFPLRRLERLSGYWGIVCDDLGAGFYAWLIMMFLFGVYIP